jgi:hypothetical protein
MKSRFWVASADDPFFSIESFQTKVAVERFLGGARLYNWAQPGFKEWFFNKDSYRHKIDYLFGLALDAAEEILVNNDPKVQGARVQLIRALSEIAGRVPHKQAQIAIQTNTHVNAAIDRMSREELEKYVAKPAIADKSS